MSLERVLIVEDDFDAADVLRAYLQRDRLQTRHATSGHQALEEHARWRPDLVLLDVMLPGLSGSEVLAAIRHHAATPIIMVTAVNQTSDRVNALLYGADDYVVKPYDPSEVIARVHAVLRRCRGVDARPNSVLRHERLVVDLNAALAMVETHEAVEPLVLTRTEFNLLALMMASPTRLYTRSELLAKCLPESDAMERVVDAHLYNLRRKLERMGVTNVVATVRGLGYRFRSCY